MSKNAFSQNPPGDAWAHRLGALEGQPQQDAHANRVVAPLPKRINLGSGKSWHPDFLNLDINDFWKPDVIADFGQTFPPENATFETDRFGKIQIEKGSFELIAAHDVLEHIDALCTCMKNCLDLLDFGGLFDILVPHDLSFGAWQDPTHVRAFNERSWLYYTDWFWYLGWSEARFEVVKLDFNLSERGQALAAQGHSVDEIAVIPRAVDSMRVVLRKVPLSEQDRMTLAHHQQGPNR